MQTSIDLERFTRTHRTWSRPDAVRSCIGQIREAIDAAAASMLDATGRVPAVIILTEAQRMALLAGLEVLRRPDEPRIDPYAPLTYRLPCGNEVGIATLGYDAIAVPEATEDEG